MARAFVDEGSAVGLVMGFVSADSTWVRGFGHVSADEVDVPDGDTIFDVASLTGRFTGMLVFDAIHTGAMSLDHPIARYFQQSVTVPAGRDRPLLLRDLVLETSGLPDLPPSLAVAPSPAMWSLYSVEDLHRDLATVGLDHEPGERVQRSLLADAALGMCLDRASTVELSELWRSRIVSRLGLASTGFDLPADAMSRVAPAHDASRQMIGRVRPKALRPATGLLSSGNDMSEVLRALIRAAESPWIEMDHYWWTILGRALDANPRDWGDFPPDFVSGDSYVGLGSASALFWAPGRDRALVVLCNTATPRVEDLARRVFDAWLEDGR